MKKIKKIVLKIWQIPFIRNKYILTSLAFVIWLLFLDDNNILNKRDLKQEVEKLEASKLQYLSKIKEDSIKLNELTTDKNNLEKFAREQYLMKKKNEDIFIIVDENNKGIEEQ